MKLWLDDVREAPKGWVWAKTAQVAKDLLDSCEFEQISLDHDLGDEGCGTGYDVVCHLENKAYEGHPIPQIIEIHSANPVGIARMRAGIESIRRIQETPRRSPRA